MRKRDSLLVAGTCLLVHLPGFFRTITGANEGLYAVMGREIVHGHLPYVTVWEAKPPLFFDAVGLAMRIFGVNFFALHALSFIAALVTAFAVLAIGNRCGDRGRTIGLIAAVICAVLYGSDDGTAIEGETLATAAIAPAFALIAAGGVRGLNVRVAFGVGILSTLALGMKIIVAPICAVAILAAAIGGGIAQWCALVLGAAIPLAAMILPYLFTGRMDLLVDANILTITRRFGVPVPHPPVAEIARQQLEAYFPLWIVFAFTPAAWRRETDRAATRIAVLMIAWLIAGLLPIVAVHESFAYQWTVMMPPAAVLAAWTLVRLSTSVPVLAGITLVTVLAHATSQYVMLATPDVYAKEASFLKTLPVQERTSLYVASDNCGLYLLAGAPTPTRFPDGAHLYANDMQHASGSPGEREVARIFALHPALVAVDTGIVVRSAAMALIESTVHRDYHVVFTDGTHQLLLINPVRRLSRSSSRP